MGVHQSSLHRDQLYQPRPFTPPVHHHHHHHHEVHRRCSVGFLLSLRRGPGDGEDSTTVVSSTSVVQGIDVAASPVVVPAGSTTILTADNDGNEGIYNADSVVFLLEVSAAGSLSPFKFF